MACEYAEWLDLGQFKQCDRLTAIAVLFFFFSSRIFFFFFFFDAHDDLCLDPLKTCRHL